MAKYIKDDIEYTNIKKPRINTGTVISNSKYNIDSNDILQGDTLPVVNAIDINWGGANVNGTSLNTTSDLLNLIKNGIPTDESSQSGIIATMLNVIYGLQKEVIRLRNSFKFGIYSYSEDDFGMPAIISELGDEIQAQEPLWAIDECELSFVDGLDFTQEFYDRLSPKSNYRIIPNQMVDYKDTIIWEAGNVFENVTDSKIYFYLTTSSKKIIFHLTNSANQTIDVDINNICVNNYPKYNILFIISRKVDAGENFLWLSISEWGSGNDIINGYINEHGTIDEITAETPVYFDSTYNITNIEFVESTATKYIYKLDVYSRYQDFSSTIEASTPTNVEDYKYRAASITIRSVSTNAKLQANVKKYQNNELIFCEADNKLYIYTNGKLINIGSGNGGQVNPPTPEDIMENYQILKALSEQGLITIEFIDDSYVLDEELYDVSNIKSYILSNKVSIKETLNDIAQINFINMDTGKEFNVKMNPYGEWDIKSKHTGIVKEKVGADMVNKEISSMQEYMTITNSDGTTSSWYDELPADFMSDRAFDANVKWKKKGLTYSKDFTLNANRIQIGSVYAPLKTDKVYGCTHAFIELANSSDEDFFLDGCYLHYSYIDKSSATNKLEDVAYERLELDGYIPAGGTYLIRCKQYSTIDDPNTFIDVATFDKEWYVNGELLDLSIVPGCSLGLALTYGHTVQLTDYNANTEINPGTVLAISMPSPAPSGATLSGGDGSYLVARCLIDSKYIGDDWGNKNHWALVTSKNGHKFADVQSNTIYKVTFELDPAKQACNSFSTKDSSRIRWQNAANDNQYVNLNRKYIEFKKTQEKKLVSDYTPKASFEHKNVITDKTQLDKTKPNAVVCSFGINPYTTRCFNWVSAGVFDEAVVIKDPATNKEYIIESYKNVADDTAYNKYNTTYTNTDANNWVPTRKEFPHDVNNIVYGSGLVITNLNKENEIRETGLEANNVGKRLSNRFPGNNESYTSHKCIVTVVKEAVTVPTTYEYYVARLDSSGRIDDTYKSEIQTFTLYPKSYQPRLYQITDQQGFHWIEYQAWGAAAVKVNELIDKEKSESAIMPIIINTGDAVQSGGRLNEWLDYYISGHYLFNHYEQMNVVGNNDLCDSNINALGTGDDTGKSNGYFFHIFNCYEIPVDTYKPIINNVYVPSLYYMDLEWNNKNTRLLFINSEITQTNCKDWFKMLDEDKIINIYTGYTINGANGQYVAAQNYTDSEIKEYNLTLDGALHYGDVKTTAVEGEHYTQEEIDAAQEGDAAYGKTTNDWKVEPVEEVLYTNEEVDEYNMTLDGHKTTSDLKRIFYPIYEILWQWTNISNTTFLPICHEMPFTVVTNACLDWTANTNEYSKFRSLSDKSKLIGSHTNQITDAERGKGVHWMSRLFEYRNIQICLGGHKHTYACTYPTRENYLYTVVENGETVTKWSYDKRMDMPQSLKDDTAIWVVTAKNKEDENEVKSINLSKFPIIKRPQSHKKQDSGAASTKTYSFDNHDMTITISTTPQRFYPCVECKTKQVADINGNEPGANDYIDTIEFDDNNTFVIYLMCQATGYKLTSNKELPSEFQRFSMVIPKTTGVLKGTTWTDSASADQQKPMFVVLDILGNNQFKTKLVRLNNISSKNDGWTFNQQKYGKNATVLEYLVMSASNTYGAWIYYNGSKFVQTDVIPNTVFTYDDDSKKTFTLSTENKAKLLNSDIVDTENIYLFTL